MSIFKKIFNKQGGGHSKSSSVSEDMIFTHNCAARIQTRRPIVCGRLEQTASMMSMGSTLATTIDGTHKGAGMTKMQGQISRVQYYYENQKWISDVYFKQRGLDELGYTPGVRDSATDDSEDVVLEGEIELDNNNSKTVIDFSGEHAEIDTRQNQRFEEV